MQRAVRALPWRALSAHGRPCSTLPPDPRPELTAHEARPSLALKPRLDVKGVLARKDEHEANMRRRRVTGSLAVLERLHAYVRNVEHELNALRRKRNAHKGTGDAESGRLLRERVKALEGVLADNEAEMLAHALDVPNLAHPDVPLDKARLVRLIGTKPDFTFKTRTLEELAEMHDLVDFDSAAKVSGSRFYYLKNKAAELEMALVSWAMTFIANKGFSRVLVPDLIRAGYADAAGFQPRSPAAQIYSVEESDLVLVGTAELGLAALHADKTYTSDILPIKHVGFSHCYRKETSHRGRLAKGLYRVHQFSKVEMFVVASEAESDAVHADLLAIQVEILEALGLHARVLDMPAHDLGAPASRKFDIEVWLPSRNDYGEVTSASNCTDYQARRLGIRHGKSYAHTLNATGLAVPRIIMALLENGQREDGSVVLPEALAPYMGGKRVIGERK